MTCSQIIVKFKSTEYGIFSALFVGLLKDPKRGHIFVYIKKKIKRKEWTQKDPLNGHQKIQFMKYSVICLHSLVIVTFPFVLIL